MNKIAIFGVPRSGTSWLSQIFNSHPDVAVRFQPLFSFGHKGSVTAKSDPKEIELFFEELLQSNDEFALMKSDHHRDYPVFHKTPEPSHIAFKETRYLDIVPNLLQNGGDIHVLGIIRNPMAVLSSWWLAPKEFDPNWDFRVEWMYAPQKNQGRSEEFYGFQRWKEVAFRFLEYANDYPGRFTLVSYGELVRSTLSTSRNFLAWCGLPDHPQVIDFINKSTSINDEKPYSVFRAKSDDTDWKNRLPADIVDDIYRDLLGTPLSRFLE